jgi:hypothetical protein
MPFFFFWVLIVPYVVHGKFLSLICHSGLDPESSVCQLDSRLRGNDGFEINGTKR